MNSPRPRVSPKGRWIPFWVWPVLALFAIGTVWLRLSVVGTTYDIDQTNRMIQNARKEQEQWELKVARLRSPAHLEELARKKFHLSPPRSDQIVRLQADKNAEKK